jgi:hypothetical protein
MDNLTSQKVNHDAVPDPTSSVRSSESLGLFSSVRSDFISMGEIRVLKQHSASATGSASATVVSKYPKGVKFYLREETKYCISTFLC